MWKVFSQDSLQTGLTTMSRTVRTTFQEKKKVEGKEKQSLGNVQTKSLCLPSKALREPGMRLLSAK